MTDSFPHRGQQLAAGRHSGTRQPDHTVLGFPGEVQQVQQCVQCRQVWQPGVRGGLPQRFAQRPSVLPLHAKVVCDYQFVQTIPLYTHQGKNYSTVWLMNRMRLFLTSKEAVKRL